MKLHHIGIAGTMESGDIYIEMEPCTQGITITLDSIVESQFGNQIRRVICETLKECGVDGVSIRAIDKGALDCTIRARVMAAIYRGADDTESLWGRA